MEELKETEKRGSIQVAWVEASNDEHDDGEIMIHIIMFPNKENGQEQHTIGGRPSNRPKET